MRQLVLSTASLAFRGALTHLLPEGGQRTARRNAWVAMSGLARDSEEIKNAELALLALVRRPAHQGGRSTVG